MEIQYDDLEKYLLEVFSGIRIINVDFSTFILKQPSNLLKIKSNIVYSDSYNKAVEEGLLPLKNLEILIVEKKIFTDEDRKKLDSLESKLEAQHVLLSKIIKVKGNTSRVLGVISNLKNEIENIKAKQYNALALSAENKANDDRVLFLCQNSVYTLDDVLYWKTYDSLLKETHLSLKNEILLSFMKFYRGIDTGIIRHIARSNLWRIRFVTSQKTSEALFGIPTSEYTNDQLNLVYWSNFYQNIYEMMPEDRPSELVIEDDDALDSYMKSYYEERQREDQIRSNRNRTKTNLSAFDSEEVIITKSNVLYEDMKYDKPREAQKIRDRVDIKKRAIGRSRG